MTYYESMTLQELEQERERLEDELLQDVDRHAVEMIEEEIGFIDSIIATCDTVVDGE